MWGVVNEGGTGRQLRSCQTLSFRQDRHGPGDELRVQGSKPAKNGRGKQRMVCGLCAAPESGDRGCRRGAGRRLRRGGSAAPSRATSSRPITIRRRLADQQSQSAMESTAASDRRSTRPVKPSRRPDRSVPSASSNRMPPDAVEPRCHEARHKHSRLRLVAAGHRVRHLRHRRARNLVGHARQPSGGHA